MRGHGHRSVHRLSHRRWLRLPLRDPRGEPAQHQPAFRPCLFSPERFSHLLALNWHHPWPSLPRLVGSAWGQRYTALVEYPWLVGLVLRRPGVARWLLRRGVADPAGWQRADLDEFALPASDPARARADQALHWQFVRHDLPRPLLQP